MKAKAMLSFNRIDELSEDEYKTLQDELSEI